MSDSDTISTSIPDMGAAYHDPLVQDAGHGLTGPGGALHRYAIRPEGYRLGDEDFITGSWRRTISSSGIWKIAVFRRERSSGAVNRKPRR